MPFTFNTNLYRSIVLEDAPTVFWECNETSGTTIKDISGHGNDGATAGSPTLAQTGPFGSTKSITCSAAANGISRSAIVNNGDYTMECWVKFSSVSNNAVVLYNGNGGNSGSGLFIYAGGGNVICGLRGGISFDQTSTVPSLSTWYYMVMTRSGTTDTIYLNNSSIYSNSGSVNTIISADGFWTQIDGQVSNVAYYTSVLSTTRMSAHYAARLD